MAKKKHQKMTAEAHAERDKTQRMARERIAYHESKAREQARTHTSRQTWSTLLTIAYLSGSIRRADAPFVVRWR